MLPFLSETEKNLGTSDTFLTLKFIICLIGKRTVFFASAQSNQTLRYATALMLLGLHIFCFFASICFYFIFLYHCLKNQISVLALSLSL